MKIITTCDGSHSLLLEEMNETYHSTKGALQESEYVFIQKGIVDYISDSSAKEINIFEMGFGTGLNAFLTLLFSLKNKLKINYYSIETNPISLEVISALNYPDLIDNVEAKDLFNIIHSSPWDKDIVITPNFTLHKVHSNIQTYTLPQDLFDIVYFDAFAPSKQEEVWSVDVLTKIYDCLKQKGTLTTYCAQGQFKRNLKSVGFTVEELPGPPGKKEMTRGRKYRHKKRPL